MSPHCRRNCQTLEGDDLARLRLRPSRLRLARATRGRSIFRTINDPFCCSLRESTKQAPDTQVVYAHGRFEESHAAAIKGTGKPIMRPPRAIDAGLEVCFPAFSGHDVFCVSRRGSRASLIGEYGFQGSRFVSAIAVASASDGLYSRIKYYYGCLSSQARRHAQGQAPTGTSVRIGSTKCLVLTSTKVVLHNR